MLAACNICFLKTLNYIEVPKYPLGIIGFKPGVNSYMMGHKQHFTGGSIDLSAWTSDKLAKSLALVERLERSYMDLIYSASCKSGKK